MRKCNGDSTLKACDTVSTTSNAKLNSELVAWHLCAPVSGVAGLDCAAAQAKRAESANRIV